MITFTHKWTVENFDCFYSYLQEDDYDLPPHPFMFSDNISPFSENLFKCNMELCPNGVDDSSRNHISLFLCSKNNINNTIGVKFKLSILDDQDKDIYVYENDTLLDRVERWGTKKAISKDQLFAKKNHFLLQNKLTILCQISLNVDQYAEQLFNPINTESGIKSMHSNSSFNALNAIRTCTLEHRWTIDNYSHLQTRKQSSAIKSKHFYGPNNEDFSIELVANTDDDRYRDYVLVFLSLNDCLVAERMNAQLRLSMIGEDGQVCFAMGSRKTLIKGESYGWPLVRKSHLQDLLDIDDKVTIYCELQIRKYDHINCLKSDPPIRRHLTKSYLNASPSVISFAHRWTIDNCGHFYHQKENAPATLVYVNSEQFISPTKDNHKFYLGFYPNGNGKENSHCCSIYLYYLSLEEVEIEFIISILDEQKNKFETKKHKCEFSKNRKSFGWACFVSTESLLKLLPTSSDKLYIYCEIQIIDHEIRSEIEQSEDNSLMSHQLISKSYYNAIARVIEPPVVHRWTIDNFSMFYSQTDCQIRMIKSKHFGSTVNGRKLLYSLCLYPNGHDSECQQYLSIFLKCESANSINSPLIRVSISIIDRKETKSHTNVIIGKFFSEKDNLGVGRFISIDQLLDNSAEFLPDNRCHILCEVSIVAHKKYNNSRMNPNPIATDTLMRWLSRHHRMSTIAHRWTIDNFNVFYAQKYNTEEEEFYSQMMFNSSSETLRFYLGMKPAAKDNNFVSLCLYISSFISNEVLVRYQLSILDDFENAYYTKNYECKYSKKHYAWIDHCFISRKYLQNSPALLPNGQLTIFCKITAIESFNDKIENNCKFNELLEKQNHCKINAESISTSSSVSIANGNIVQFEHIWPVDSFESRREQYIDSPEFYTKDAEQYKFKIRLFPNGHDQYSRTFVSIFLLAEKRETLYRYTVSLIDCTNNICYTKEGPNLFQAFSWRLFQENNKYISHKELLDPFNGLLVGGVLKIYFSVKIFNEDHGKTGSRQLENLPVTEKISNSGSRTFTQVFPITHKWTLTNYLAHLKANPQNDLCFRTVKLWPMCDDQLQFYIKLFPIENCQQKDRVSIFVYFETNKETEIEAQFKVSILDKEGRKCTTKVATGIRFYQVYNLGFGQYTTNSHLKRNSSLLLPDNNLTLFCEIFFISNYSNNMSQLQSSKAYAIDDFRFAWKTRKLGQIITKYESITDLQIHKCSIEFAIENFLNYTSKQSTQFNQYQHLKSDKFSATEWEHMQFHLQVYPNGEDEQTKGILVIHVCSLANKEEKLIVQVQLSIIDQNGNKNLQKAEHQTLYKDNYLEWTDFVHHKMLFDNNCELLHNNSLIICCEIEILLLPEACFVHTHAALRIEPELCHLLTNQQPSNFVLKCGKHSEAQLHAHKSILAHRSNVFASMFHYDTIEKRNSAVTIIDIEPDVLWALLQFIYTGQIENLEKFALELFVAAEKYNLIQLKSICQEWLCANLTPQTVANILVTADMHCVVPMKHLTIAYFHQNAEEIIRYNSGQMIPNSIFIELYQDIIRIHRNCTNKSDEQNNIVQLIKMAKCDDDVREDRDVSVL